MGVKERSFSLDMSDANFSGAIGRRRSELCIRLLPLTQNRMAILPDIPRVKKKPASNKLHGNPFDLLIIATSMVNNLPVLSTDGYFPDYTGLNVVE